MAYPKDLLSTRAIVKPGMYAVIPKDGLVNNVLPCLNGCRTSIVASPKMGASFVMYICDVQPGGGTIGSFGNAQGEEAFLYVISGAVKASGEGREFSLAAGGYLFTPPSAGLQFKMRVARRRRSCFINSCMFPAKGFSPIFILEMSMTSPIGITRIWRMSIKDLLPVELNFDMNMHILSFDPGGCHPIVETHVQEHGMYILQGRACT